MKKAIEIIFDNKQENILGYSEIDPKSLTKKWCNLHNNFIWTQYDDNESERRILFDTQILTNF